MSALLASRGIGAIIGSIIGGTIAGLDRNRLRRVILMGFCMAGAGYFALGTAGSLMIAMLTLWIAHAGGASVWTASTTLLQLQTEDRFRGRVFSAEFAFITFTLALSSLLAGQLVDAGLDVRTVAMGTGVIMLVPAIAWMLASRRWEKD
jgi:MFS family permease